MTPPLPSSALDLHTRAEEAAAAIRAAGIAPPRIAVVLGSGQNQLADRLPDGLTIPYERIPHFPRPTVTGHQGKVIIGEWHGTTVLMLQGRFHYYEGHDRETVTFPMRVLQRLGVGSVILTAATGGIRADLRPGDLMLLSDHLNLLGVNPLRGLNDDRLGTRFPDMTEVYSARLRKIAGEGAERLTIHLSEGVYACMPGPSYETPAEIRMLRTAGADLVGMSTALEAIAGRHLGAEVLAISLVTNPAAGLSTAPLDHGDVVAAAGASAARIGRLLADLLPRL
jgi:purine-nucleoside phosphorylase